MTKDIVMNYNYYYMGAVLSGLEIIAMGGAIWNEAQLHIVEKQVRDLWDKHRGEIEAVATLYQQVDKMSFNESLFAQLNTSQSFSIQSWGMIAREIKNQTKLIDEINNNFSDKLAAMMSLTDSNYVGLGLSIFGFSFACFMFWKSVAPQQYEKLKANFKDSGKTLVEKVKTAGRKVNLTSMDQEGRMNDTEITPEQLQTRSVTPESENPKNKGRWSKGTVATSFIRIGFLCFMIYSFVQGRKHISQIRDKLKEDKEYFSSKGEFQTQLQHCIDAIKIFVCDVSNLAQASRAVIEDLHAFYLTRAVVETTSSSHSALRAGELTTDKFGLTDSFFEKTLKLKTDIKKSDKDQTTYQAKLQKFVDHFKEFYSVSAGNKAPDQIFLNITAQISSIVGKDSILSHDLYQRQTNLYYVAKNVARSFLRNRKQYDDADDEEKIQIDRDILNECQRSFKVDFIEDEQATLRPHEKQMLAGIMINYCNSSFRGTDPTGAKIYNVEIKTFKDKKTYQDLLNHMGHQSIPNNIPVHFDDKQKQREAAKKMLDIAIQLAAKLGGEYQDVTDLAKLPEDKLPEYQRYLNIKMVATGQVQKGETKMKLVGSNIMKFKARGNYFLVTQQMQGGNSPTLKKEASV